MKITVLCPHLRIAGGVRAILTYADRLARRGHQVELIVPERRSARTFWRPREPPRLDWMPECRARIRVVPTWDPAELAEADVIIATAWQSAATAAAAAASRGVKFYFVQHYESLYHGEPSVVDATYRLPLRKIVISSWLQRIMRERFAAEADLVVTPVDAGLFHRVPMTATGLRPRVLMLHHDYPWKGVADGLDAVARARAGGARLQLVGFGLKRPRGRPPYDEFHANPPQRDLAALYSSADIYLCPSWDEGLGMPSMEAMACGAALVTYDNGGCRDYAIEGVTALVARRRDVEDLAAKLVSLILEPALRARLAAAGREHITTTFDWERAVTQVESILQSACVAGPHRPVLK